MAWEIRRLPPWPLVVEVGAGTRCLEILYAEGREKLSIRGALLVDGEKAFL